MTIEFIVAPWNAVALLLVPLFLAALAVLLAWFESSAEVVAPLHDAAVVTQELEVRFDINTLRAESKWDAALHRLETDSTKQGHSATRPSINTWVDQMITQGGKGHWRQPLVNKRDTIERELRRKTRERGAKDILRHQKKWRRRSRGKYELFILLHVVWPGYKAVLDKSGKAALHFGALGFIGATAYWFIMAALWSPPDFISAIGNGSAFGGFLGLSIPIIINATTLVWVNPGSNETAHERNRRRVAASTFILLNLAFIPLFLLDAPEKMSSLLIKVNGSAKGSPVLSLIAVAIILQPLIKNMTKLAQGRSRVTTLKVFRSCYRLPVASLTGLVFWSPKYVPDIIAISIPAASLVILVLIVVMDASMTRKLNADHNLGSVSVPYSGTVIRFAMVTFLGISATTAGVAIYFTPPWCYWPIIIAWSCVAGAIYYYFRRRLRKSAENRQSRIESIASSRR